MLDSVSSPSMCDVVRGIRKPTFHQALLDHLTQLPHSILREVSAELRLLKPLIKTRARSQFGWAWLGDFWLRCHLRQDTWACWKRYKRVTRICDYDGVGP